MRKSLIKFAPLALAVCTSAAFADDSSGVTLYGILDTAVANIQHNANFDSYFPVTGNPTPVSNTAAPHSVTGMVNGGLSQSRWGIKGQENLGNGLKAIFKLESAINVPTGTLSNAAIGVANGGTASQDSAISGQLFSRGAFAGLSSDTWGTVTAGRNTSFFLDNMAITDPLGEAQDFSPLGYSGSYGGGGNTDDSRVDNSIKYEYSLGRFTLGGLYKFGGVAGYTAAQNAFQLDGTYVDGPLAVQLGYEEFHDALHVDGQGTLGTVANGYLATPGVTPGAGTLNVTAANTKALLLAARYDWHQTTVNGGYERQEFTNPSNPGADHVTSIFGIPVAGVKTAQYGSQFNLNVLWIGATQHITRAFSLTAATYHVGKDAYTSGITGSTIGAAAENYYTLLADYRLSRQSDLYAGLMKVNTSGSEANMGNRIIGAGFRHAF